MDADTRHQLKQNELAEALSALRDWNNPTTRYTLLVLGVALLAVIGWKVWRYSQARAEEHAWQQLGAIEQRFSATDDTQSAAAATELEALIKDTSNAAVGAAARLRLAEHQIETALRKPEVRPESFAAAIATLKPLAEAKDVPPSLAAPAMFALATAYESTREFDQAAALYEQLRDEARFRGNPLAVLAADRRATLDDIRTQVAFIPGAPPTAPPPPTITSDGLPIQLERVDPAQAEILNQKMRAAELTPPPKAEEPPAEPATPAEPPAAEPTEPPAPPPAEPAQPATPASQPSGS